MLFLDRKLGAKNAVPADVICRAVVEHVCQNGPTMQGLWDRLRDACAGDLGRAIVGILALVDGERAPMLHIVANTPDVVSLAALVADLTAIVSVVPALAVAVSAEGERLDDYLAATPECRALALVREGLIRLERGADWTPGLRDRGAAFPGRPLEQTAWEGRPTTSFRTTSEPLPDDAARSAAERYLFERLQAHPETAGLFELNGRLDGSENGRAVEVDLLSRAPRVAVEIDGYYHFTDLEAYRRDRRKDVLLQHAGYFVVRCLADDVASRLEEILETILAAVRRGRAGRVGPASLRAPAHHV
ncbi:MAG TPA: DUF559 domain-containing protein [Pirellulales bacterium]|nr:DUF559 domain-containing protein [Pirellulales bacterium]